MFTGLWRFSDSPFLRGLSRCLCSLHLHVWVWYDGRPMNCGVCGLSGHPLAGMSFTKRMRRLLRLDPHRITGAEPRADLTCDWCEQIKHTTIEEIWTEANPTGRLVRLCQDCGETCDGG